MNCPQCKGEDLQKRGKRSGKQRFSCKKCGCSFTEGIPYKKAPSYDPLSKVCLRCGSSHVVRDGKLLDGTRRYLCRDCNLRFGENSNESLSTSWICPDCKHTLQYSRTNELGQQEYKCPNCNKYYLREELTKKSIIREPFSKTNIHVNCPFCNSKNIRKTGMAKGDRQKYLCKDCKKYFMTEYKVKPKKEGLKEEIISCIMHGGNIRKVGEKYGFSERYIREFLKPYYSKETITKEQRNLIIKFGYYCSVPVDYMAEYIKCSEKMCRKVLKEYKALIG